MYEVMYCLKDKDPALLLSGVSIWNGHPVDKGILFRDGIPILEFKWFSSGYTLYLNKFLSRMHQWFVGTWSYYDFGIRNILDPRFWGYIVWALDTYQNKNFESNKTMGFSKEDFKTWCDLILDLSTNDHFRHNPDINYIYQSGDYNISSYVHEPIVTTEVD